MSTKASIPCEVSPEPRLRAVGVSDVRAIFELERSSFANPWTELQITEELSCELSYGLLLESVVEQAQVLMGYAFFRLLAPEAELLKICVNSSYLRQGYAGRILAEARTVLRANGVTVLHLEVRESNLAARKFYLREGFTETGVRPRYYSGGENAILYSCQRMSALAELPGGG
ncbi:MAG: ribosomal protein S18-alanine N-acetyltransferase [bacterium]|nr:ribosomal protein S18-alanine N-acetyltransferase [bacterium]